MQSHVTRVARGDEVEQPARKRRRLSAWKGGSGAAVARSRPHAAVKMHKRPAWKVAASVSGKAYAVPISEHRAKEQNGKSKFGKSSQAALVNVAPRQPALLRSHIQSKQIVRSKRGAQPEQATKSTKLRRLKPPRRRQRLINPKPPRGVHLKTSASQLPSELAPTTLSSSYTLLNKLFIRNKNQHYNQPFWKPLSLLRKALNRLSRIEAEDSSLKQQAGSSSSAEATRKLFERESQLRSERELWSSWTRDILQPRAFVAFSGLVKNTQFANLGLVLLGVLADVMIVVGPPTVQAQSSSHPLASALGKAAGKPQSLTGTSLRMTGTFAGETVERQYDSDDIGEVVERRIPVPSDISAMRQSGVQLSKVPIRDDVDGTALAEKRRETAHSIDDNIKSTTKKKKKGRGKNDIDDLFAGLT